MLLKYLCDKFGANVHIKNDFALKLASKNGHINVVEKLCRFGADVNANNDESLQVAAEHENIEILEMLLQRFNAHFNAKKKTLQMIVDAQSSGYNIHTLLYSRNNKTTLNVSS